MNPQHYRQAVQPDSSRRASRYFRRHGRLRSIHRDGINYPPRWPVI